MRIQLIRRAMQIQCGGAPMNYDSYVSVFNTGDDAALVDQFFAEMEYAK